MDDISLNIEKGLQNVNKKFTVEEQFQINNAQEINFGIDSYVYEIISSWPDLSSVQNMLLFDLNVLLELRVKYNFTKYCYTLRGRSEGILDNNDYNRFYEINQEIKEKFKKRSICLRLINIEVNVNFRSKEEIFKHNSFFMLLEEKLHEMIEEHESFKGKKIKIKKVGYVNINDIKDLVNKQELKFSKSKNLFSGMTWKVYASSHHIFSLKFYDKIREAGYDRTILVNDGLIKEEGMNSFRLEITHYKYGMSLNSSYLFWLYRKKLKAYNTESKHNKYRRSVLHRELIYCLDRAISKEEDAQWEKHYNDERNAL